MFHLNFEEKVRSYLCRMGTVRKDEPGKEKTGNIWKHGKGKSHLERSKESGRMRRGALWNANIVLGEEIYRDNVFNGGREKQKRKGRRRKGRSGCCLSMQKDCI